MTEIERKALALVNEVECAGWLPHEVDPIPNFHTICRAIEQHEAFRQEVSEAVEAVFAGYHDAPIPWVVMRRKLEPFIIAKPDPLVEAWGDMLKDSKPGEDRLEVFRAALAARGLKIVEDK